MTKTERLLRKWQKRLRLQDWDIRLTKRRPDEVPPDSYGANMVDAHRRESTIWLSEFYPEEMEDTIIHELLHCYTKTLRSDTEIYGDAPGGVSEERLIHTIAGLLRKAYK